MVNKTLFKTVSTKNMPTAVNHAGGRAYSLTNESALAQMAVTGCLNNTYYASAEEQLDKMLDLARSCKPEFVAKTAVYGRNSAFMKDTPVLLLAYLSTLDTSLTEKIFTKVVNNTTQLRKFVQIIRSGQVGRKSFGTALKRMINDWLSAKSGDDLFKGSIGQSPSLSDIIKMTHPKPESKVKEAFYGYMLDKEYNKRNLPSLVKAFEKFKTDPTGDVPDLPFRMLTSLTLTTEQWIEIARNMPWNTLRMNLNTLLRHKVFEDKSLVRFVASKLRSQEEISRSKIFPYQLMTAYLNVEHDMPVDIKNALQDALELSTDNIPSFGTDVIVCVDSSGSMQSPITGNRGSVTSKTSCTQVAALVASCIARKNSNTKVLLFDTDVYPMNFNERDSIVTNAKLFNKNGGGTDCSSALRFANQHGLNAGLVMYISDNESWADRDYFRRTGVTEEWKKFKGRNPKSKLVLCDLTPNTTTQAQDKSDVLNIGSWGDTCFTVIQSFLNKDIKSFIDIINSTKI